jgi:hypothetical protein
VIVASPHLFRALPRRLEALIDADIFRRLRRELPRVPVASGAAAP